MSNDSKNSSKAKEQAAVPATQAESVTPNIPPTTKFSDASENPLGVNTVFDPEEPTRDKSKSFLIINPEAFSAEDFEAIKNGADINTFKPIDTADGSPPYQWIEGMPPMTWSDASLEAGLDSDRSIVCPHKTPDGHDWEVWQIASQVEGQPNSLCASHESMHGEKVNVHVSFTSETKELEAFIAELDKEFPADEDEPEASEAQEDESKALTEFPEILTPHQRLFCQIFKDSAEAWYLFRLPFKPGGTQVIDGVICQYRFRDNEIEFDIRNDMLNDYGNAGVGEKLIILKQKVKELEENLELAKGRQSDFQREYDMLVNSKKELDERNEAKRVLCEKDGTDFKPDLDITFNERGGMKVSLDREASAVESFSDQLDLAVHELESFTDANPIAQMPHKHLNFVVKVENAPQ